MLKRKKVPQRFTNSKETEKKPIEKKARLLTCSMCALYKDEYPSWRFAMIGRPDIFPFPDDACVLKKIFNALSAFEQQSIKELRGHRDNGYCCYKLSNEDLNKDVVDYIKRFCDSEHCDLEEIHRFRVSRIARVYAIKVERGVFSLLFWDPEHQIYRCDKPT